MKLVFLLEKKTAKISSHRKFQSVRAAKICSRKPQKIANPQKKSPAKISCYMIAKNECSTGNWGGYKSIEIRTNNKSNQILDFEERGKPQYPGKKPLGAE